MLNESERMIGNVNGLSMEEKERAKRASQIFRDICKEMDVQVCAWSSSPGWNDFVSGSIDEAQLQNTAKEELSAMSGGRLVGVDVDEGNTSILEPDKKELAKRANEIYRGVCNEYELQPCFFNGFRAWSDFVKGRISESQFMENAKEEAQILLVQNGRSTQEKGS
jgi:hypothetical protein